MDDSPAPTDDLLQRAAARRAGHPKRRFQAEVAPALCGGSGRRAERRFGRGREAVDTGLHELASGIRCVEDFAARGRVRTEDAGPKRAAGIRGVVEPSARNDPSMRDGDSGHGNPHEYAGDEAAFDSDSDTGDTVPDDGVTDELFADEMDEAAAEEVGTTTRLASPVPDYDRLNIADVLERVNGLSKGELRLVASYEHAHRNRKTLLAKLERLITAPDPDDFKDADGIPPVAAEDAART